MTAKVEIAGPCSATPTGSNVPGADIQVAAKLMF
jgi:hypothetical protein